MALTDLPLASGKRHKKVFEDLGWLVRSEGNHIVLTHPHHPQVFLSIPNHQEVKKQTLKSIVRAAGLTDEQYASFFQGENRISEPKEANEPFRETPEVDGRLHVHCPRCGQEVCVSADEAEIAAAKEQHPLKCTGPILA
jgi:predicted RNA binding protein YcfA (HicA-like mRNA interferase family)